MVLATIGTPQLLLDTAVNALVMQFVQVFISARSSVLRPWHVHGPFAGYVAFRRRQQWQYTAGFSGDEAPYAVFSVPVIQAQDARHHGRYGREGQ